jgi:hypothetical protein
VPLINNPKSFLDGIERAFDGAILETIDIDVVEDTGAVKLQVQADGGGDLECQFAGARYILDCTPSPAEVTLTAGTDASPTQNWVWIAESGGTLTLTAGVAGFPSTAHCPIATVMVQSAASLATDGAYKVHAWTDHLYKSSENGHVAHLNAKLRALQASWVSGVTPGDLSVSSPNAYIDVTSGVVFQLHTHTFPARDMSTGDPVFLVNDPTTAYKRITTFDDITQDASGGTINNRWFSLVLWGVISQDQTDSKLFINLPTGTYATAAAATADDDATAVYSFPDGYTGTAFLIARYIVRGQDSGAWSQDSKIDLRGLLPSTSAGGGGLPSHSSLPDLGNDDHTQYVLADGTRSISGNFIMGGSQTTITGLLVNSGGIQIVNSGPNLTPFNTSEENTDRGRESRITIGGETGAGGVHYLAWIEGSHDGTGADEDGMLLFFTNRSTSGLGEPDEKMRINNDVEVATDLKGLTTRRTHRYSTATTTIAATWTDIPFATDGRTDTGFTWNGTFTECTVGFTGTIEIGYDVTGENTNAGNTRAEGHWRIQVNTGGGFGTLAGSFSGTYHRTGVSSMDGWDSASCRPLIVSVTSGDIFKVQGINANSGGTLQLVNQGCRVTLRRVAAAY